MASTIGRLRTLGIAAQPTFGQAAPSASFVVPLTNAPMITTVVTKIMNEAALGSSYGVNDIEKTTRYSQLALEFKVDEDQFPLLLKQRFTITSVTASQSSAYVHTLAYSNNTNCYYTLFLNDDNNQDYVVRDALFDDHTISFDQDFVRVSTNVIGAYPTATAVSLTPSQPKEFVGRMVNYLADAVPGTVTASTALAVTANMDFGINSEDSRFGLGTTDLAVLKLTTDKYSFNVSRVKTDTTAYDDYNSNGSRQFRVLAMSTDRLVGSTIGTRPQIQFDVLRSRIENYTEEADLDELVKENFDLTAMKPYGVADTPLKVTVVNATASY